MFTELRPMPESKRRRKIGGLPVNISSACVVYGAITGELLDPALVEKGRQKERDQMAKFEVCLRVPLHFGQVQAGEEQMGRGLQGGRRLTDRSQ